MRVDGYRNVGGAHSTDHQSESAARVPASQRPPDSLHEEASVEPEESQSTGDTIEISQNARNLMGKAPVRPEAVERARKILSSGLYNDKGVIEKTAERIAESFSADA